MSDDILKSFKRKDIIISDHALVRMFQRQISQEEVIENIINPRRLEYAIREKARNSNKEKFNCYFGYSKTLCHNYVLVIKNDVLVITVFKINRRWQIIAEKKMIHKIKREIL